MKYLGIDFGSKRIGIALSDDSASLARPVAVLKNDSNLFDEVDSIIAKENIGGIVIGNSVGNSIQREIDEFLTQISLTSMLPVELMNESFSSFEAHPKKGKESGAARATKAPSKPVDLDARAAAVILQRFLDKKSKKK